jgi:hypothetical protein
MGAWMAHNPIGLYGLLQNSFMIVNVIPEVFKLLRLDSSEKSIFKDKLILYTDRNCCAIGFRASDTAKILIRKTISC